ncbi:MAG: hypothetical protein ACLPN5_04310 [Roseiarcus sp.]
MKQDYKLYLVTIMAIIVSISLKYKFEFDYYVHEAAAEKSLSIEKYFVDTGFIFQPSGGEDEYIGVKGACLVIAGPSNRDGNEDAIFESKYNGDSYIFGYLYKNAITLNPPYFRAQFEHYLEMLKVAIGQKPKVNLMLHLAISKACKPSDFLPLKAPSM